MTWGVDVKREMELCALGIFLGSFLAYYISVSLPVLILFFVITTLLFIRTKHESYLLILISFLLGFTLMTINENQNKLEGYYNKNVHIRAVVDEAIHKESNTYYLKIYEIDGMPNRDKILLNTDHESLRIGDVIEFKAKLVEVYDNGNPQIFSYKDYLKTKRIKARIYTKAENIELVGTGSKLLIVKRNITEYIRETIPVGMGHEPSKLLVGVLLGTSYGESAEEYRSLGLSHLLAISGLHMGIICAFLLNVLKRTGLHLYIIYGITAIVLFTYLFVIGFKASAIRSFLMISMALLSTVLVKGYNPKKALAFSVFVIIMINPYRVLDLGLLMSVLAMMAIIYVIPGFNIIDTSDFDLLTSIKLILIINMTLLPIIIYNYNEFNILTIIANIIIVPLFSMIIIIAGIKLLFALVSYKLSFVIGRVLDTLFYIISVVIESLKVIEFANIKLASPSIDMILFYYFLIMLFIVRYDLRLLSYRFRIAVYKLFIVSLTSLAISILILDPLVVDFIDIGQGDSALVHNGLFSVLIDTGGSFYGSDSSYVYTLKPYLDKTVSKPLDMVFISHDDADHSGNLEELYYDDYFKTVISSDSILNSKFNNSDEAFTGDVYGSGNTRFIVLTDGRNQKSSNDRSLVIKLMHHKLSVLFTGDIEKEAEMDLLNKDIVSHVLKVAHHGSETSSGMDFLKKVKSKDAIISVGRDNPYSHPSNVVIESLESLNINIYRTDIDGRIRIISTRFGYDIQKHLPRKVDIIHHLTKPGNYLYLLYIVLIHMYLAYEYKEEKERFI